MVRKSLVKVLRCLVPLISLQLATACSSVTASQETREGTYEALVAGMECHQQQGLEPAGLECNYQVGESLRFAIVGPGLPGGSVYIYRSNDEEGHFAVLGFDTRCVVVRPGYEREDTRDFAFVSTHDGIVYRSVVECRSAPLASESTQAADEHENAK